MECSKNVIIADSINVNLISTNYKKSKLKLANWLTTSTVHIFTCTYFRPFTKICEN